MKPYRTIKVYTNSYRTLKLIAARTGETLVDLVERLSKEEDDRRKKIDTDAKG